MKTLITLTCIWILYSMYRVAFNKDNYFDSNSLFIHATGTFAWTLVLLGAIISVFYLIITYLP